LADFLVILVLQQAQVEHIVVDKAVQQQTAATAAYLAEILELLCLPLAEAEAEQEAAARLLHKHSKAAQAVLD
jgi:hypothetical protein